MDHLVRCARRDHKEGLMRKILDTGMLQELERRKGSFPVDTDILAKLSASSPAPETLQFLGMTVLWKQPKHIFVFGGGPAVVFLTRLQHRLGTVSPLPLMVIDHSQRLLNETRRALGPDAGVHLVHAPLAVTECAGRVFTTYHPAYTRTIPEGVRFDLVLIDGPPAYRYGREAPLYHLAPFLAPGAVLVLDDANREPEQEALTNWRRTWPAEFSVMTFPDLHNGLAVFTIGDRREQDGDDVRPGDPRGLDRVITFLEAEGGLVTDGR